MKCLSLPRTFLPRPDMAEGEEYFRVLDPSPERSQDSEPEIEITTVSFFPELNAFSKRNHEVIDISSSDEDNGTRFSGDISNSLLCDRQDDSEIEDEAEETVIKTEASPVKSRTEYVAYNGDQECRLIKHLESSENPFIVPLVMNCRRDNSELLSKTVPCGVQQNASLLVDLDALEEREDIFSDDNGVWSQTASKAKFFATNKSSGGRVIGLVKVSNADQGDITVRRRLYVNKSCPTYHKLMVTVEYGKEINQWYPIVFLQYRYDGDELAFTIDAHGNRKSGAAKPYVRTKNSTKSKASKNLKDNGGPKRALFTTVKDVGGVTGAKNLGILPRNERQLKYLKKVGDADNSNAKDPLAAIIELQKSVMPGFVRDIVCNDLPTVILFTDEQIDNLVKFCCLKKDGFVSELGVDLTFQLGPFYLLVTSYKNTLLEVKATKNSPSFLGPMMICMTKDYQTYLSFVHRLIREVPGFSNFLYVYGTDSEDALVNSLAAGFHGAAHLLCYIHCKKNILHKIKQIGLSQGLAKKICSDLFSKDGWIWSKSSAEFEERTGVLIEGWDTLERSERRGEPQFSSYFLKNKKSDMKEKMCKFVVEGLGVGNGPYTQNIIESINDLIEDWNCFKPQEMDKLVMALYDLVLSFNEEEELAWFGLSEKWDVRKEFQHLRPVAFNSLTPDERQAEMTRIRKIRPDGDAYKECKAFKFQSSQPQQDEGGNQKNQDQVGKFPSDFTTALEKHFSREEGTGLMVKADALLTKDGFREGFQEGAYLVDSGASVPHKVICYRSGKTTCSCSFFTRNNLCFHALAIAKHKGRLTGLMKNYGGRNLDTLATSTAPRGIGGKVPPRKRQAATSTASSTASSTGGSDHLTVEQVEPTRIVIRRNSKPEDPPVTAPLVVKKIAGGIRKCAGCSREIKSAVVGYNQGEDLQYCLARHEAYHFWHKDAQCYRMASGTRRYHMNRVCSKAHTSLAKVILKGGIEGEVLQLLEERFQHFVIRG